MIFWLRLRPHADDQAAMGENQEVDQTTAAWTTNLELLPHVSVNDVENKWAEEGCRVPTAVYSNWIEGHIADTEGKSTVLTAVGYRDVSVCELIGAYLLA